MQECHDEDSLESLISIRRSVSVRREAWIIRRHGLGTLPRSAIFAGCMRNDSGE